MIEKPNLIAAACSIVMGSGGAVNFQNGCTVVRTSAGLYTVSVDWENNLALSSLVPFANLVVAAGVAGSVSVAPPTLVAVTPTPLYGTGPFNSTTFAITTSATLGGSAADVVGSLVFVVYAIGTPGAGGV